MKRLFISLALMSSLLLTGAVQAQDKKAEPAAPASAAAVATPTAVMPAPATAATVLATPAMATPTAVAAPAAPIPNKGDVAWMLVSTALVLLMSVPALALFYGGLVRSKNMLSVLMQVFVTFSLISVLWVVYGYTLRLPKVMHFLAEPIDYSSKASPIWLKVNSPWPPPSAKAW